MPILEPQRCEARRSTGGPPCVGPVDAVRLETTHGPVIGCVLHSAILKTRSRHARLYPKTVAGMAIAAYYLASEISEHRNAYTLTRRAVELLGTHATTSAMRAEVSR